MELIDKAFSCKPDLMEADEHVWDTYFPDRGFDRGDAQVSLRDDGSDFISVSIEVTCSYHGQTNKFKCLLLSDNTLCIERIGPYTGITEDGIISINAPYPIIYIPDKILGKEVTEIGKGFIDKDTVFSTIDGYKDLEGLVLPNTIRQINDGAFGGPSLGFSAAIPFSINIPDSVEKIGVRVFSRDAYSGPQIKIDISPEQKFFTVINNALYDKMNRRLISYVGEVVFDEIKTFDIPQGIHHIGAYACCNCGHFSYVHIPSSVKTIAERAFYMSNIESIEIDEGVAEIEDEAFFSHASFFRKAILPQSITRIGRYAFGFATEATFVVKRNSYAAQWTIDNKHKHEYTDAMDWLKE